MAQRKAREERKARIRSTFDLVSSGYDRWPLRFFRDGAARLVEFAEVGPGDHVLDVATGTGWAALAAAAVVGSKGKVIGIDLSPGMLARARVKARRQGLSNVTFRLGDALQLPYRDDTFDSVLASQAIFFMPDALQALREWRRVLKRRGCLAISSQGKAAFQPMMKMYWKLMEKYGVHLPPQSGPSFETAAECRRYLRRAGLRNLVTSVTELGYRLPSTKDWWTIVWHTGMRGGIRRLTPKDRSRFRLEHLREVESLLRQQGIRLQMPNIFAAGFKTNRSAE